MADKLDGLIFSEFLVDNSEFSPGFDTDGDGQHNKSDRTTTLSTTASKLRCFLSTSTNKRASCLYLGRAVALRCNGYSR